MIIEAIFAFSVATYAEPEALTFSAQVVTETPYQVKFTPPSGHHFNLAAPAGVELENGSTNQSGTLEKSPAQVTVSFQKVAKFEPKCSVKASLYVCNDGNTYCRPVKQDFDCEKLKTGPSVSGYPDSL